MNKKILTLGIIVFGIFLCSTRSIDAASSCGFTRSLQIGSQGMDVKNLQVFLNSNAQTQVALTGAGSAGKETVLFGPATKNAVAKFQELYKADILTPSGLTKGTGFFGVSTMNKANALCGNNGATSTSQTLAQPVTFGSQGTQVSVLQSILKKAGYFDLVPTGYFGAVTKQAIINFQKAKGLLANGLVDTFTLNALNTLTQVVAAVTPVPSFTYSTGGHMAVTGSKNTASISNIRTTVGASNATITWTTDQFANSVIEYGTTNAYGTVVSDSTFGMDHSLSLTGLSATTTYYFKITSTNTFGNPTSIDGQSFTTNDFDYYVDSSIGNDSNPGTTALQPFSSFMPLSTIGTVATGTRIGIKQGTNYKSELVVIGNNITVDTYGSGGMPYIDAREIVDGGFTATPGRVNVYQKTIALPGSIKALGNIFEDEKILMQYNNIASVEAATGSAYVADWTATSTTLYVHTSDNTDPNANGKVYRYSKLLHAILITGDNAVIRGVRTRGQAHQDGSIAVYGINALVENCRIEDGARHSLYLRSGGVVKNTYFYRAANDLEGSGNFIVWNQPEGSTITATTYNTTFDAGADIGNRNLSALSAHGAIAGQLVTSSMHYNPTFINVSAISNDHARTMLFDNPLIINSGGVSISNIGSTITINNIQASSTFSKKIVDAITTASADVNINGGGFTVTGITDSLIRGQSTTQNLNVNLSNLVINIQKTASVNPRAFTRINKGTFTINNTKIGPTVGPIFDDFFKVGIGATGAITGDNNVYPYGAQWTMNGVNYFTLGAWQASTTQDVNSQYATLTAAVSDNFNRADENLEAASSTWTRVGGSAGQAAVRSNQLAFTGTTQTLYQVADQSMPNEWVRYTLTNATSTGPMFAILRATDINNFVAVRQSTTQYQIIKDVANVITQTGTSAGITPKAGDEVILSAYGDNFVVYVNKQAVTKVVITDPILLSGTKAGVLSRSTIINPALDDFAHGVITQ